MKVASVYSIRESNVLHRHEDERPHGTTPCQASRVPHAEDCRDEEGLVAEFSGDDDEVTGNGSLYTTKCDILKRIDDREVAGKDTCAKSSTASGSAGAVLFEIGTTLES